MIRTFGQRWPSRCRVRLLSAHRTEPRPDFQATELASDLLGFQAIIDMLLHRLTCLCCSNGHPPIDPRPRLDLHARN
jgi:hypothetical protein